MPCSSNELPQTATFIGERIGTCTLDLGKNRSYWTLRRPADSPLSPMKGNPPLQTRL